MILSAKNISKTFQKPRPFTIFENVSLELCAQESIAIIGKSGVGKTTLLHILGALQTADTGILKIGGETVSSANAPSIRNKQVGFVFQDFCLLEDLSALENVLMPAKLARAAKSRQSGLSLLEQVGLSHLADHPTHLLSGGEKQRVCIARALCNDPPLILADEPSGNLDQETSQMISDLLFHLVSSKHKGLILVTHDETLAKRCSKTFRLGSKTLGSHFEASSLI